MISRNKKILLNKANDVLKIVHEKYQYALLNVNDSYIEISLNGVNTITHELGEPLIEYFIKKNINWSIKIENGELKIKIWIW